MLHVHNKDTESTIQLLWRNINKIFIYIEKGTISCFLCVVNLFNEARKGYRFSRVYLLRFSKGQFEPCDIHLNNNKIGRRDSLKKHSSQTYNYVQREIILSPSLDREMPPACLIKTVLITMHRYDYILQNLSF